MFHELDQGVVALKPYRPRIDLPAVTKKPFVSGYLGNWIYLVKLVVNVSTHKLPKE